MPASAVNQLQQGNASTPLGPQPDAAGGIDVRPMNLTGVASVHEVRVARVDDPDHPVDLGTWALQPQTLEMAGSL